MLENTITTFTMTQFVASSHGNFISFFSFFFVNTFFSLKQERERALGFHWNYNLDNKNTLRFHSNNSISTKNKKEEKTYNLNPYIKLAEGASSCVSA